MTIKKIIAAVMAVTILAGMTACGNTAEESVSESTTAEVTTTIAETTTAAEETTTVTEETTIAETETSAEPEDEGFSQEQLEMTSVTIPDGTVKIEDGAYSHYFSLTDVTIPDGVTEIGKNAFRQCYELTNINIPDSVTKIGVCAFYGDESLKSIEIPDSINEIGEQAFAYSALTGELVIKGDNCEIGNGAFFSCIKLESVIIEDGVTKIGSTAFADCESLKSVVIPDSVTEIGDGAFKNCVNLTSITVPDKFNDRYEDIFGKPKSDSSASEGFTYVTDNAVATADKIPAEWLASAETCLNGNERYERFVNYDPAYEDTFPDVSDGFPPLVEFEEYLDENGTAKAKFTNGMVGDFNGNGKNEAFVVLGTPYFYTENGGGEGGPDFLVYINENGEAQLLTQGYDIRIDSELVYNGFSHFLVRMGINNASNGSFVYSADGTNAKVEIEHFLSLTIDDTNNRILKGTGFVIKEDSEISGYTWDSSANCYADITISYDEYIEAEENNAYKRT